MYSIYKINFPNGKSYIGQTKKSVRERYIQHCWDRTNSKNNLNRPIIFAMKKYKDKTTVETLEINLTLEEANYLEKYYIKHFESLQEQNGYNLCIGGNAGNIMSDKGKERRAKKMQKYYNDPEYCKKITKHIVEKRNLNPKLYSKKMTKFVNDYFANPKNKLKHSQITKITNNNRQSKLNKSKLKGGKPFYCVETGEIFLLLQDAADKFKVDKRRIHAVLKYPNRYKTINKKYTFKYIESEK